MNSQLIILTSMINIAFFLRRSSRLMISFSRFSYFWLFSTFLAMLMLTSFDVIFSESSRILLISAKVRIWRYWRLANNRTLQHEVWYPNIPILEMWYPTFYYNILHYPIHKTNPLVSLVMYFEWYWGIRQRATNKKAYTGFGMESARANVGGSNLILRVLWPDSYLLCIAGYLNTTQWVTSQYPNLVLQGPSNIL